MRFRRRPRAAGIFSDFDGVLAPIVDDASIAELTPGLREVLVALAGRFGRVGVIAGRTAEFLEEHLPDELLLVGLHGLEEVEAGEHRDHPLSGSWREVVDDVASVVVDRGPDGLRVEHKGTSITLHYRGRPEIEEEVRDLAHQQAARSGLVCRPVRMSFELHPPIGADKGTALLDHVEGLKAVCFLGDDVADLSAYDALDELAAGGLHTVRVAVVGPETPPALLDRADVRLGGPAEVVELLGSLLTR